MLLIPEKKKIKLIFLELMSVGIRIPRSILEQRRRSRIRSLSRSFRLRSPANNTNRRGREREATVSIYRALFRLFALRWRQTSNGGRRILSSPPRRKSRIPLIGEPFRWFSPRLLVRVFPLISCWLFDFSIGRLESVYRQFLHNRENASKSSGGVQFSSGELKRELHTVLGTAKWQVFVEFFEQFVRVCVFPFFNISWEFCFEEMWQNPILVC